MTDLIGHDTLRDISNALYRIARKLDMDTEGGG
jgi:hypothetical protein